MDRITYKAETMINLLIQNSSALHESNGELGVFGILLKRAIKQLVKVILWSHCVSRYAIWLKMVYKWNKVVKLKSIQSYILKANPHIANRTCNSKGKTEQKRKDYQNSYYEKN